jgi:hypothetical protein
MRIAAVAVFFALALQAAVGQMVSHGVPASALSPTADGRTHGPAASALSPTPIPPGIHRRSFVPIPNGKPHRFGTIRGRHDFSNVVPIFYPVYYNGYGYDYNNYPSPADPATMEQQAVDPAASAAADDSVGRSEDALRMAYLQGQRDAMARELEDTRRKLQNSQPAAPSKKNQSPDLAAVEEKKPEVEYPPTVFIFKDGRQIETKNFAIMGQTLYDISSGVVKKVQLNDLDTAATLKANDDRGIVVKLP